MIERMQLDSLQPEHWPTTYADRILQAYSRSIGDTFHGLQLARSQLKGCRWLGIG